MEKLSKLVERLLDRTEKGLISWQSTADDHTFQFSFPDSSVFISYYERTGYYISIMNSEGHTVDGASATKLDGGNSFEGDHHEKMSKLYEIARRQAFRAEETLDGILAKLEG